MSLFLIKCVNLFVKKENKRLKDINLTQRIKKTRQLKKILTLRIFLNIVILYDYTPNINNM